MSATMKSGSAMASRSFADEWAVGLTARHMLAGETAGGRRAGEAVIRQAGTRESGKALVSRGVSNASLILGMKRIFLRDAIRYKSMGRCSHLTTSRNRT